MSSKQFTFLQPNPAGQALPILSTLLQHQNSRFIVWSKQHAVEAMREWLGGDVPQTLPDRLIDLQVRTTAYVLQPTPAAQLYWHHTSSKRQYVTDLVMYWWLVLLQISYTHLKQTCGVLHKCAHGYMLEKQVHVCHKVFTAKILCTCRSCVGAAVTQRMR